MNLETIQDIQGIENQMAQTAKPAIKFSNTHLLAKALIDLEVEALADLLDISMSLAKLNHQRYQQYSNYWLEDKSKAEIKKEAAAVIENHPLKPAIFTFDGDAYKSLDVTNLDKASLLYLQKNLLIFSGLYGLLHPFDMIAPYRIDMGTSLKILKLGFDNLYQIWQDILVNYWAENLLKNINLNNNINNINTHYIVNLASQEYAKAFHLNSLKPEFKQKFNDNNINIVWLDIEFAQRKKDGSFASIGIKNKQARGLMLRYLAENQIENIEEIMKFRESGYQFMPEFSISNANILKFHQIN